MALPSTKTFKTYLGAYKLLNLLQQRGWTQSLQVPSLQFCDSYTLFFHTLGNCPSPSTRELHRHPELKPLIHVQMILDLSDQKSHSPALKVFKNWATSISQLALRLAERPESGFPITTGAGHRYIQFLPPRAHDAEDG